MFCKEVHYELRKRRYFAPRFFGNTWLAGMRYGTLIIKAASRARHIPRKSIRVTGHRTDLRFFEGFMDFLSFDAETDGKMRKLHQCALRLPRNELREQPEEGAGPPAGIPDYPLLSRQ